MQTAANQGKMNSAAEIITLTVDFLPLSVECILQPNQKRIKKAEYEEDLGRTLSIASYRAGPAPSRTPGST